MSRASRTMSAVISPGSDVRSDRIADNNDILQPLFFSLLFSETELALQADLANR
jgi:hypothetical protein